jgi:predicted CoA-binding protein
VTELSNDSDLRRVLEQARTVAVIGAHVMPSKAAFYVPEYLHQQGYRVLPVNPVYAGQRNWDATYCATLAELDEAVDLVDVFRRGDQVGEHLEDILALSPRPKVVWLQLGIRNDEAATALMAVGIDVVQDRCTLAEHRRLGIGRRG